MQIDQNMILNIIIIIAAIALMKYMPRLTAWGIRFADNSEVKGKLDAGEDIVVIDVRTEAEVASTGHVPGAVNLPLGDLRLRLKDLGSQLSEYANHPVYVMCRTENRSSNAAKQVKKAGFNNLAVIKGGIKGWTRAGFPVDGGA